MSATEEQVVRALRDVMNGYEAAHTLRGMNEETLRFLHATAEELAELANHELSRRAIERIRKRRKEQAEAVKRAELDTGGPASGAGDVPGA